MSRALAVLRPEPGWSSTADAARALGLDVVGHPLFDSEALGWNGPAPDRFDALLVGSSAVFAGAGQSLQRYTALPVHAVGETTAAAARAAGFVVGQVGDGGLQAILDRTAGTELRYLRLCGEQRVALAPHRGQVIVEQVVYRMRSRAIASELARSLEAGGALVALHSAATAAHFASEIDRLAISRSGVSLLALGPRVAQAAGPAWEALHIADRPTDAALLAKAAGLCEERL